MSRSARVLLSWLVSLSFLLMPYSTLHAHVSDHEHSHIHGGHSHDLDPHHDTRSSDRVVKITAAAGVSTALSGGTWADWLPVVCIAIILALTLPFVTAVLRPPSRKTEPISNRSRQQPPLRGPPFSILAL